MKNFKEIFFILCLIFFSTACKKEDVLLNANIPTGTQLEENKIEITALAKKLSMCSIEWQEIIEKYSLSQSEELVAMGIVANECLKIEKVEIVSKILESYRLVKVKNEVNWNELSKNILKLENI